jgi:hypothetical protein
MKELIKIFLVTIAALIITCEFLDMARADDTRRAIKDQAEKTAIEKQLQDERINELEKQIRILKTDLYIMQNGYESE